MIFGNRSSRSGWYKNQSIRNKIILLYIPLVVLPLIVLGYLSNRIYSESIVTRTEQNVADNSRLIATRIEGMLQNAESCANILTLNLNRVVKEQGDSGSEEDPRYHALLVNQVSFALLVFPDVDSAVFIDSQGRAYPSHPSVQDSTNAYATSAMSRALVASSGESIWLGMQKRDYFVRKKDQPVLTLGKRVIQIETGQTIGWLLLNVDEKRMSGVFPAVTVDAPVKNLITDREGRILSSSDAAEVLAPIPSTDVRDKVVAGMFASGRPVARSGGELLVGQPLSRMDLLLLSQIPVKALTRNTEKVSLLIVALASCCLLLTLVNAGLLARSIATPLVRLTRTMRQVQDGSLDKRFDAKGQDEIGLLGEGFNRMLVRIGELLRRVKAEQRQNREYELALFQSQIKPHFLYNSLDVIYALSEIGRPRDVQRTTKALADYYRIVLSKGKEIITIREELQSVRDYLAIQHIRYSDVFDYRIEVEPEVLDSPILKLTLQPIVENAIYHGLKPANRMGKLVLTGRREGSRILLVIQDDGVGMDEARQAEIWSSPLLDGVQQPRSLSREPVHEEELRQGEQSQQELTRDTASFGLRNVNARIQLYFGKSYGIRIESASGAGTTVEVALAQQLPPAARTEDEEGDHA